MQQRYACAVAVLALWIGACTVKTGRQINTASINDVVIGQTSKQQVEQFFGPPSNINMMRDTENWTYMSSRTDIRGSNFIPYANWFHRETGHNNESLHISFDHRGIVTDCSYTTTTGVSQTGLAHVNDSMYTQVATGKRCGEAANAAAAAADRPAPAAKSRRASPQN